MFSSESVSVARKNWPSAILRHFLQARFVEMHPLSLIKDVAVHVGHRPAVVRIEDRDRRDAVDPGADGVELDMQRLDRFRRGVRRDFAGVIFAVGQENDGAAFRFLVR